MIPTNCNHLFSPAYVYFSDSVSGLFESELKDRLIDPVADTWHAMKAAGVRSVAECTRVSVEARNPQDDATANSRLRERITLIKDALHAFLGFQQRIEDLSQLVLVKSDFCRATYVFRDHGGPPSVSSETERIAILDYDEKKLYYTLTGSLVPWDEISAQIASYIVHPKRDDAVKISPHINACLEPDSFEGAERKLIALGMLKMNRISQAPSVAVSDALKEAVYGGTSDGDTEIGAHSASSSELLGMLDRVTDESASDGSNNGDPLQELGVYESQPRTQQVQNTSDVDRNDKLGSGPNAQQPPIQGGLVPVAGDADEACVPSAAKAQGQEVHTPVETVDESRNARTQHDKLSTSPIDAKEESELEYDFFNKRQEQSIANSRRWGKKREQAKRARKRSTSKGVRSHRQGKLSKAEVAPYLFGHYRDENGNLRCQMCESGMPFKGRNKKDYWERRELLTGQWDWMAGVALPEEPSLFLLLCPECNSFYGEFVFNVPEVQEELFDWFLHEPELDFVIPCHYSGRRIRFVPKHKLDIHAVLSSLQ